MAAQQPGTYVFDFGQNLAGVAHVRGTRPAGTASASFCGASQLDGSIYTENLRNAKPPIALPCGNCIEEFQPTSQFTASAMWRSLVLT
jgi:alpha-L-rhamnosidase